MLQIVFTKKADTKCGGNHERGDAKAREGNCGTRNSLQRRT
jgi:hypothetical protein